MPKPQKEPQHRSRSEDELRLSLEALVSGKPDTPIPPHYDEAGFILSDGIDDLMEKRQTLTDMLASAQGWIARVTRR